MPGGFHDTALFPVAISQGATGGPVFSTVIIGTAAGGEQRIAEWAIPRRRWDVAYENKRPGPAAELVAFFYARQARAFGFRFLDWADHNTVDPATGAQVKHPLAALNSTTYQLQKLYVTGSVTVARPIRKPVGDDLAATAAAPAASTVRIYNGSTEVMTGWTVDHTTGIVTFTEPPGYAPAATFEFHVPVRFGEDVLPMTQHHPGARSFSRISIIEIAA